MARFESKVVDQNAQRLLVSEGVPCKICGASARPFDSADMLRICCGKVSTDPHIFGFSGVAVGYYRCRSCEFLFTDFFDNWTSEDFSRLIYNDDYVKVDPEYIDVRPTICAEAIADIFASSQKMNILDYGSGSGSFSEKLFERGFSKVVCYDPFSHPARPQEQFDIITCFEVIEHSPEPLIIFEDMLSFLKEGGILVFSQTLQPANIENIRCGWWYVGPRNGHVSLYSQNTLTIIAEKFGTSLWKVGPFFAFAQERTMAALELIENAEKLHSRLINLMNWSRDEDFHDVEQGERNHFRWTRVSEVKFSGVPVRKGKNVFYLDFSNEIIPGYAKQVYFSVNGQVMETCAADDRISCSFSSASDFAADICLMQPDLKCPADFGRPDQRMLGVAICVAE